MLIKMLYKPVVSNIESIKKVNVYDALLCCFIEQVSAIDVVRNIFSFSTGKLLVKVAQVDLSICLSVYLGIYRSFIYLSIGLMLLVCCVQSSF